MNIERRIFLIRHGETNCNKNGIIQGGTTIGHPLNEKGKIQAIYTGMALGKLYYFCGQRIITTPLLRAKETATLIQKHLRAKQTLITTESLFLRELDYGRWEGLTYKELRERHPKERKKWISGPRNSFNFPGAKENLGQAQRRILKSSRKYVKDWLANLNSQNKDLLFVTHSVVNKFIILDFLKTLSAKVIFSLEQDNCCINIIQFSYSFDEELLDSPKISLKTFNNTIHLEIYEKKHHKLDHLTQRRYSNEKTV